MTTDVLNVASSSGTQKHSSSQDAEPSRPIAEGHKLTEAEIWFSYKGRIGAGQYWGRFILGLIGGFLLALVVYSSAEPDVADGILVFFYLFGFWPGTALAWKRLHDQDRSGAMALLVLIPLAGPIIWLVFSLLGGTSGPNRFGPRTRYRY